MRCADMFDCHMRYVHCGFIASVINDFFVPPFNPSNMSFLAVRIGENAVAKESDLKQTEIGETFVFKEVRTISSRIHLELVWAFSRAGGSKAG